MPDPAAAPPGLDEVLGLVHILPASSIAYGDAEPIAATVTGAIGPDDAMARTLAGLLYDHAYTRRDAAARAAAHAVAQGTVQGAAYGGAPAGAQAGTAGATLEDAGFLARLDDANSSRERWDAGWVVHQFGPNGQVFVRKGERERIAMPGAFITDPVPGQPPGMAPALGAPVRLRAPRAAPGAQPGYYVVFGETLDELADALDLVRLYFNCPADEGPPLLGSLSAALNRFQVPFQMKLPAAPSLFGRTDAAVLYLGGRYFPIAARIIAALRAGWRLDTPTPLFARPLWPGIAAAAEPGNGESFGAHRCRLTAEGILDAWRAGSADVPARRAAVAARFAAAGLDLARPWLGPGGIERFHHPEEPRLP